MIEKYFGGLLPAEREAAEQDEELVSMASGLRDRYEASMEKYAFQQALQEVFKVVSRANKYIDETAPWTLAKDEANLPRLAAVLYNLIETVRISAILLKPFIPDSSEAIRKQIGAAEEQFNWDSSSVWGVLGSNKVEKGANIFPRIDLKKELEELEAAAKSKAAPEPVKEEEPLNLITIDDFKKVDIGWLRCLSASLSPSLTSFFACSLRSVRKGVRWCPA